MTENPNSRGHIQRSTVNRFIYSDIPELRGAWQYLVSLNSGICVLSLSPGQYLLFVSISKVCNCNKNQICALILDDRVKSAAWKIGHQDMYRRWGIPMVIILS